MNRTALAILAAVLVLVLAAPWVIAQRPLNSIAAPAIAPARSAGQDVGRFQIVNGTPALAANIMLLDTVTGDSWVSCNSEKGMMWCAQPRSDAPAVKSPR
jgi:hypothetical protein